MSFALKLAWKYSRAGRRSLARFTAAVAVAGIAAGVASLIFAQALARGFADEMRDKILASAPHIAVARRDEGELADWRAVREILENVDNVRSVDAASFENAVVIGPAETAYAVLRTPRPASLASTDGRSLAPDEIAVGERLAAKLRLTIGETVELATLESQTPRRVRVARFFATGLYDYDATWVEVAPEMLARFRGQTIFAPRSLSISVTDIYQSDETARRIGAALGEDFRVVDWQEANRPLFAALSLERRVALAIISLIVFVAALNITTTLALLVNERRLDIAVLRVCGARARDLVAVFALEGLALAVAGVAAGLLVGLAGCRLADYFRLVSLSAEVYELGYVPLRPAAADILLIGAGALSTALAATLYPALKASRVKPLENLRRQ